MITRFAPSPTGPLHLGHAFAAIFAHEMARAAGGQFLLRIEDIDQTRARPEWEQQIYGDLAWLGLSWDGPVLRQSDRLDRYEQALSTLWSMGVLYPCNCYRRDILAAVAAPQEGGLILTGPDGLIYPGTCRPGSAPVGPLPRDTALRLNMKSALDHVGKEAFSFLERGAGPAGERGEITFSDNDLLEGVGDVVLARRDMGTSYHLAVVVDDADQGITDVTRGADLFEATKIHIVLQSLLGLTSPTYHHHRLIRDDNGKRLAKRDDARAIAKYRADGATPEDIRRLVGLSA